MTFESFDLSVSAVHPTHCSITRASVQKACTGYLHVCPSSTVAC
jgi:hypothetical protein